MEQNINHGPLRIECSLKKRNTCYVQKKCTGKRDAMKRFIKITTIIVFAGIVMLMMLPNQVQAASDKWSSKIAGEDGEDLEYRGFLSKDGKEAWIESVWSIKIYPERTIPEIIVIPETFKGAKVTKIGPDTSYTHDPWDYYDENMFLFPNTRLAESIVKEVVLPSTITEIGEYTFNQLHSLEKVNLPKGLEIIDWAAFAGTAIRSIDLPEGLTTITAAFRGCRKLNNVHIPASVKKLTPLDFRDCRSLTNLTIDKKNKYCIVQNDLVLTKNKKTVLFGLFRCKKVEIPKTVTKIAEDAFAYAQIEEISIPSSVKTIDSGAFLGSKLKKATLHEGLIKIKSGAFVCEYLKEITIPKTVTNMSFAFKSLVNLKQKINIKLKKGNKIYARKGNCIYKKSNHQLVYICPITKKIVISNGIESVPSLPTLNDNDGAKITSVTYPKTLKKLGIQWLQQQYSFYYNHKKMRRNIIFKGKIPPSIPKKHFNRKLPNVRIYVPKKSLDAYKKAFKGILDKNSKIIGI